MESKDENKDLAIRGPVKLLLFPPQRELRQDFIKDVGQNGEILLRLPLGLLSSALTATNCGSMIKYKQWRIILLD